jgi:hypothetical protein
MPIGLSELANERRKIDVEIRNIGSLEVTYRPNVITPAREAEIKKIAEEEGEDSDDATMILLMDVVESWDLTGPMYDNSAAGPNGQNGELIVEHGAVVPLELRFLQHVPSRVQNSIIQAIGKDANPDPNGRGRSAGRSRRED